MEDDYTHLRTNRGVRQEDSELDYPADAPQHCPQHSGQLEFTRTVNNKLTWCLSGVAALLAGMGWLFIQVYAMNGTVMSNRQDTTQNAADIAEMKATVKTLQQQMQSNEEFHRMWEIKESVQHGNGVELHQLKK